ncbi:Abi family protein [Cytophaga sp. FL35]|uniref:Abi family protein n=1 Tax=Cytophaga sp. FL35 TaxID=1904456 RepID=UPI0016536FE3|nr:Abi family protein [Cytophaga sp. FL35]MBC6997826.1 Abi family protein [Cytophaga sp. FL35]
MSKEIYNKLPKTFNNQVQLLKQRGLTIENERKAERILTYVSYNRLSNYWFPMLKVPKEDEIFKEGSSFETIFRLYQFDSELRAVTFQAIEQIEISIRTQVIYHFSHQYDSGFWYEKVEAFSEYPNYIQFLSKMTKAVKSTKQEFILKYQRKYSQFLPPSWKSFELLTFTDLLSILKNIKNKKDIIPIAKSLGLHHSLLISWVESFIYIRNIIAHHGRLWNIILTIKPEWLKSPKGKWVNKWENNYDSDGQTMMRVDKNDKILKLYSSLCSILYCLQFINPYHKYKERLIELFEKYPEVDLYHMGFPSDWKDQDLWK